VNILKAGLVLLLSVWLFACGSDETPQFSKGQTTPVFTLKKLEGGTNSFPADFKGKIVTLRFWADWCPFCKTEMKEIEPIYKKYQGKGLVILAVNVRQDKKTAAAFLKDMNISYNVLLDEEGNVARDYGVAGLPTTFIFDRNGKLYTRILGESTPEVFEKIVKELM